MSTRQTSKVLMSIINLAWATEADLAALALCPFLPHSPQVPALTAAVVEAAG